MGKEKLPLRSHKELNMYVCSMRGVTYWILHAEGLDSALLILFHHWLFIIKIAKCLKIKFNWVPIPLYSHQFDVHILFEFILYLYKYPVSSV